MKKLLSFVLALAMVVGMIPMTVFGATYVAQINDDPAKVYTSLADATEAAADSDVIKLLDNCSGTSVTVSKSPNVSVKLDLNGKTYTSAAGDAIKVGSGDTITLKDGTGNDGKIIANDGDGLFNNRGGFICIEGGTYVGNEDGSWFGNAGTLTITGGVFNVDPSEYVPAGIPVTEDNGWWTVGEVAKNYVAQIGDVKYETLAKAFAAAKAGETVEVLAETEEVVDLTTLSKEKNLIYFFNPEFVDGKETEAATMAATSGVVFVKDTINAFADTYSYECELRTYNSEGTADQKLTTTKTIFYGDMETLADLYAKDNKNYATTPKIAGNQCWKVNGLVDMITKDIKNGTRNYSALLPNKNALNSDGAIVVEKDMILSTYSGTGGRIDFRLMGDDAFTLNLNGHEIYQVSGDNGNGIAKTSDGAAALRLSSFTNMTIVDSAGTGTVVGSLAAVDYYGDYSRGDGGVLTLESGTLVGRMVPALSKGNDDNNTASFHDDNEKGSIIRMDDTTCTFIMNGGTLDIDRNEYRREGETKLWKTAAAIQVTQDCENATITLNGGNIERTLEDQQAPTNQETDYPEIIYRDVNAKVTKTVGENMNFYPVDVTYVAQIGDDKFETLAEAIAAVPTTGEKTTITMIDNEAIDVSGRAGLTIATTQNIVLDLNGYTVAGICSTGKGSELIINNGTFVVKDSTDVNADGTGEGKLTYGANPTWDYDGTVSGSYSSNLITNYGKLTVESGYLLNAGTGAACYVVDDYAMLRDVSFTLNGGKLVNTNYSAIRFATNSETYVCKAELKGGIVESLYSFVINYNNKYAPKADIKFCGTVVNGSSTSLYESSGSANRINDWSGFKLSVESGRFSGADGEFVWINAAKNFASGGYFVNEIDEMYIAPGYECVALNADSTGEDKAAFDAGYGFKIGKVESPVVPEKDPEWTVVVDDKEEKKGEEVTEETVKKSIEEVIENPAMDLTVELTGLDKVVIKGLTEGQVDTSRKIKIDLKQATVSNTTIATPKYQGETLVTTVKFDVTPTVTIEETGKKPVIRKLDNSEIPETGLTFRLGVNDAVETGTVAKVFHEGEQLTDKIYFVQEENGKKFIEVTSNKFSEFAYELQLDTIYFNDIYKGAMLVLGDENEVRVRFLLGITPETLANYQVDYTFLGKQYKNVALTYDKGSSCYYFDQEVCLKEFTDDIVINVTDKTGTYAIDPLTFSAAKYCYTVLGQTGEKTELYKICSVLLDYSTYMQLYKEYNTDKLANADVAKYANYIPTEFGEVTETGENYTTGSLAGIKVYGKSLSLEGKTKIFFYFKLDKGVGISNYTFTCEGKTLTPIKNGSYYYVEAPGFVANELNGTRVVTVTSAAGSMDTAFSPLYYAYSSQNKDDVNLAKVARGLNEFYKAACAFVEA